MYSKQDILYAAKLLGINFDKFTLEDLITGVNIIFDIYSHLSLICNTKLNSLISQVINAKLYTKKRTE